MNAVETGVDQSRMRLAVILFSLKISLILLQVRRADILHKNKVTIDLCSYAHLRSTFSKQRLQKNSNKRNFPTIFLQIYPVTVVRTKSDQR